MPQGKPLPGERYRHFKNKDYQILAIATHSESRELMVVYQALYGDYGIYVRPYEMFISEVDHVKYPEVTQKYRFAYLEQNVHGVRDEKSSQEGTVDRGTAASRETSAPQTEVDAWPSSVDAEEGQESINPALLRFLDAESMAEKYEILKSCEADATDRLIDDLSASLDVVIPEGSVGTRFQQLKNAVSTMAKYDTGRLR